MIKNRLLKRKNMQKMIKNFLEAIFFHSVDENRGVDIIVNVRKF
jgi:hypothetical protein